MKKLIAIFVVMVLLLALCSCGNESYGLGNFSFKKVHVSTYDGKSACLTVEKWHDNSTGIEVKTKEKGSLFLSEGTYILCEDKCPICD